MIEVGSGLNREGIRWGSDSPIAIVTFKLKLVVISPGHVAETPAL